MVWTAMPWPVVWAQAVSAAANPNALAPLALRRWCGSLTLSSPESVPSLFGLWAWLGGLAGLFALASAFQGPVAALRQALDVPGLARLAADAAARLRRAGRMLAAVVGLTVLSWTGSQSLVYNRASGRDDVLLLTRTRHPAELAFEQGVLAALTPLRDVAGLGSNLPLLAVASLLMFRASADAWGGVAPPWVAGRRGLHQGRANAAWLAGALYLVYRLVSVAVGVVELPLGNCVSLEAAAVPALMAVCDGLLLGWVLAELRGGPDPDFPDVRAAAGLLPAGVVSCLAALPARYLAPAVLLGAVYLPASWLAGPAGDYARWQLGAGLAAAQGAALLTAGLAGAAAWGTGSAGGAAAGYARLLASQGGRLVAAFAASGAAAGAAAAGSYLALMALPAAPWVLNAADSYAHYGSLAVGLLLLSALVELGGRARPGADAGPTRPE